jgi:hypothetical protein
VKNDPNTQAFADRLRTQVPGGEAPAAAGAAAATAVKGGGKKWRIAPTLGYHLLSFKDWNDIAKPANTPASPGTTYATVSSGFSLGAGFGYALSQALELGLDLDYYLVGAQAKSGTGAAASTTDYNFNLLWAGPQASYTFARVAGGKLGFDAGLGLGFGILMGSFNVKNPGASINGSISGSGLGFKAKLGADWDFSPGFGLGLDLGYRILSVPKVEVALNGGNSFTFKKAGNTDLPLDYSGLDMKLGFNIRF